MRGLAYTTVAQEDLTELVASVAAEVDETAAERALESLLERCEDLAKYPDMGRRRPDLDAYGLSARSLVDNGRLIVYTRCGNVVVVARVLRVEDEKAW